MPKKSSPGPGKEQYRTALKSGDLDYSSVDALIERISSYMKETMPIPRGLTRSGPFGPKLTAALTRLPLYAIQGKGNPSWEGLAVGFPGTRDDLSTECVGTPFLRELLYPILDLLSRLRRNVGRRMPCLYVLGTRFNDVMLRKFALLESVTPHVIVLTRDLLTCAEKNAFRVPKIRSLRGGVNEYWLQQQLCRRMLDGGLVIPTDRGGTVEAGLLCHELPASEGTIDPERLDILGHDVNDHSLIAFEIKGPRCGRVQLENLLLQGMEHRNWLERNKMAVKLLLEGPRGKNINTRKRVKLVLGYCDDFIPELFVEIRERELTKDRYLGIDFCRLVPKPRSVEKVQVTTFSEP